MTNRPSWAKTVSVYLTERGPTCQNLHEAVEKSKRLIVFLQDKIDPEGLLVKDRRVFMLPNTYPALVDERGGLYRVRMWRHWDREKRTFLMEFEPATEDERTVHEVLTE